MRGFLLIVFLFFWGVYSGAIPAFCTTQCPYLLHAIAPPAVYDDYVFKRLVFSSVSAGQSFIWDTNGLATCVVAGLYNINLSYTVPVKSSGFEVCLTLFHNTQNYTKCDKLIAESSREPFSLIKETTQTTSYLLNFIVGDLLYVDFAANSRFAGITGILYAK